MNNNKLNGKQIIENLEIQAKKLAVLLHNSNMPDDVKESWLAMLPEMSLKQMDRLLNILEAKYLDEQTKGIDEKYNKEIKTLIENFQKERDESENKFLKIFNKFKNSLKI